MKTIITSLLKSAIESCQQQGIIPADVAINIQVEHTKDKSHGDFASNIALLLAKPASKSPRDVATALITALPQDPAIQKVELAGPGFINFFLNEAAQTSVVKKIFDQGESYGACDIGKDQRIFLEYVSANPNGPLHVGHGRGAAYGASLANLLKTAGYHVHSEYYVNDAGRQMNILTVSIWIRYLELHGATVTFPMNGYKGDYVKDLAQLLKDQVGARLVRDVKDAVEGAPLDEQADGTGDKETHIDALIENCRRLLGQDDYTLMFNLGLSTMVSDIKEDLAEFGVVFDEWFSEKSLMTSGAVEHAFDVLSKNGLLYEVNGALWFKSTQFGDDKDRCVRRENGVTTYFASDIAYMLNKFERGADRLIYVFGADHHGYLPRIRACIQALGHKNEDVDFELIQFAILYRGEERVQMSTRSGSFITLRELRDEVGNDAARFFYVMREASQHMDFDLALAKSQSNDNPVYYINYAHARICQVFRQLADKGMNYMPVEGLAHLHLLKAPHEADLLRELARYAELIPAAAQAREPHRIALYLRELAHALHSYYTSHMFLVEDPLLRHARLCLIAATRQVLANGLKIIGVKAAESM